VAFLHWKTGMAFNSEKFSVIVQPIGEDGIRFFCYETDDDAGVVAGAGYFARGRNFGARVADLIFVIPATVGDPYIMSVVSVDATGNATAAVAVDTANLIDDVLEASARRIPAIAEFIHVAGYAAPGDGGDGLYVKESGPEPNGFSFENPNGFHYWKKADFLKPEDAGWFGDGVAADTNAQRLFNAGGLIKFTRGGQYKITTAMLTNTACQVEFEAGAWIDATGIASGQTALSIIGPGDGTPVPLTASTTPGQYSFRVSNADAAGFTVGQGIRVYSNVVFTTREGFTSYKGETHIIKRKDVGVTDTNIITFAPAHFLQSTANNAMAVPVTFLDNVILDEAHIRGEENLTDWSKQCLGVLLRFCRRPILSGMQIDSTAASAINLQQCVDAFIENPTTSIEGRSNLGYGVAISGCRNTHIRGHRSYGHRHHVTVSSHGTWPGQSLNTVYEDFACEGNTTTIGGGGADALDTHAGCINTTFRNGVVRGATGAGLNAEGSGIAVEDVRFTDIVGTAVQISSFTADKSEIRLNDITINRAAKGIDIGNTTVAGVATNGHFTLVDIDGLVSKGVTGPAIEFTDTAPAQECKWVAGRWDIDAGSYGAVAGHVNISDLFSLEARGGTMENLPAAATGWRIQNCRKFPKADFGRIQYYQGVGASNSSGNAVQIRSTSAITPMGDGAFVTADCTPTNTAVGIRLADGNTTNFPLRGTGGNANTGYNAVTGSTFKTTFL
jgi:hypothetical protein